MDFDTVIFNINSCLLSSKSGVPLNQLERDYFTLIGEGIPLGNLGFNSLEQLLINSGKFTVLNTARGVKTVRPKASLKTQHLTELIQKQKSKSHKKKSFGNVTSFSTTFSASHNLGRSSSYRISNNGPIRYNSYQPKIISQSPSTNSSNSYNNINNLSYVINSREIKSPPSMDNFNIISNTDGTNNLHIIPPVSMNSLHKFQIEKNSNNSHKSDEDKIPQNNFSVHKKCELKSKGLPMQNMCTQSYTAQSRLFKYLKKCAEPLNKVNDCMENHVLPSEVTSTVTADSSNAVDSHLKVVDDKDYIVELKTNLENLNLSEPFYECMIKKEKSGETEKVNDKLVSSSFPVECNTVDYAKKVAAEHALDVLKKQYGEKVVYPITDDINTMALRIKEFLKPESENGLMGEALERLYREKFLENLPVNWVPLLEVFSYFSFDKITDKIIVYFNEVENNHNGHGDENGCLEASVEEENFVTGTPLTFEDYDEKSVLVSANYGSSSVWIRFVGQNADENFIEMQAKLNNVMNTTGIRMAQQVIEGEFYAVLFNNSWHRVQISGLSNEDGTATCFMVDTGNQLNISKDKICCLEPVFMKTRTQTIECVLTPLFNFGVFDDLKELLDEMILNKTFFLIPDVIDEGYFGITLYEKGEGSGRINNELIIQRLLDKLVPRLPSFEENTVVNGYVSAIVETGHLYLQLKFDAVTLLADILPSEELLLPEYFLKNKRDVNKDNVYLTKYYEYDEVSWYRVQVLEIVDDIEVQIVFIDYGNHAKCKITDLVNLEMFDPLMSRIPPQAIKVSMNLIPLNMMTTEVAEKIFAFIGNDKILVNLINAPTNDVPCIQLYKILPDSEDTICINVKFSQVLSKLEKILNYHLRTI